MDHRQPELTRGLGPWAAASLVVGTIIGTGIFLKTSVMAATAGSAVWVLAAWACAGGLSLFGALTYAELGAMFPQAGGEYVFLRHGYGPGMGYLYAWNRFWIATPGSIAAYAVGTTTFLGGVVDIDPDSKLIAIGMIVLFTLANCLRVRTGGALQTVLTAMKVVMIGGLAFGALFFARGGDWSRVGDSGPGFPGWSPFGAMVLAALWAYDGWNNLPMAAGEVRNPQRTLPRAIVWGSLGVVAIYALVNIGYFHALPFTDVAAKSSTSIAERTATTFLGVPAQALLMAAMAISAISAMNGSMLTGARVPYAVARDGLAPKSLAHVAEGARVPVVAVLVQGGLGVLYALSGKFDELTDAVVFASWLFYGLNAGTVLLLRIREPDRERSYRVPGFPVVPVIFMVLALLLLVNAIVTSPRASALGLVMTALGGIVYTGYYRPRSKASSSS
ncbi:MAG TPA: amino acid permease [Kofleriaceae bacterium]|nr:amino acid permease [Kofleriaceae bacterium]